MGCELKFKYVYVLFQKEAKKKSENDDESVIHIYKIKERWKMKSMWYTFYCCCCCCCCIIPVSCTTYIDCSLHTIF